MNEIEIGRTRFSRAGRTMVIAEIGVNHDGKLERAMELVRAAAKCDADAVKLQIFRADKLMHESAAFASYQKTSMLDATPIDMLRRFEMEESELRGDRKCDFDSGDDSARDAIFIGRCSVDRISQSPRD